MIISQIRYPYISWWYGLWNIYLQLFKKIKKLAKTLYDKEHVTSFVRYKNNIKKFNLFNNTNLFNFARLTLDEKEDFKIISTIIKNFYLRYDYKLADIIKIFKKII